MEFIQTTSDMKGRLIKYKLSKTEPIMAVHEAIVNSIHANSSEIIVELKKDGNMNLMKNKKVSDVIITDNGDGFNKENFDSFTKMDSTFKLDKGGKGIGRLAWLKVFNKVEINSVYREGKNFFKKTIQFSDKRNEELAFEEAQTDMTTIKTEVILKNIRDDYYRNFPKKIENLAEKILHHCLIYFMTNDSFDILVKESEEVKSLRELYDKNIKGKKKTLTFIKRDHNFSLNYLTVSGKGEKNKNHKLKFTANNREVLEEELKRFNPLFEDGFGDEEEKKYILAYLESDYLNEYVTDDRTGFSFGNGDLLLNKNEIGEEVARQLQVVYGENIEISKNKNKEKINDFLIDNPEFRFLYKSDNSIVEKINHRTAPEKIEDLFHEQAKKSRKDIKEKIKRFDINGDYQDEFKLLSQEANSLNHYELSSYILHRRVILELLDKIISRKQEDNKYHYEDDIHNLIFPMRSDGQDVDYEDHNLWLLDDKLSYYNFLASDIPINKFTEDKDDKRRPDLAIFRTAYSDKVENELQSNITIVEFKRPDRISGITYADLKEQVMGYRDKFLETKIKSQYKGRPIQTREGQTKFHIYVVCELTEKLKKELKSESFVETLDGMGYFRYYDQVLTMLEVISFDKLYNDANKRNKIFFKKLGIGN